MKIDLTGKRALVAGSTQGIGKAIATQLAEAGAGVIAIARNEDKLKEVVAALPTNNGQKHGYLVADFSNPNQVKEAVNELVKTTNPIHILINNTGGPPAGLAIDADVEAYLSAFNQHLVCNQILAQAVVSGMKAANYGRIINIISTSVKQPLKGLGVSNTIRGAVANWSKTLATELGPFGITVNNVLPGATGTERLTSIIDNKSSKTGASKEDVAKDMLAAIPAGRFAEPEEVAFAATFLASPMASYINGINVPVDGGRTTSL